MRAVVLAKLFSVIGRMSVGVAMLAVLLAVACAPVQDAPRSISSTVQTTDYLIGPGDTLQVFVWHNPELTTTVPVRPDGRISIPLVEDVECAGKTPKEVEQTITASLEKFVKDPHVTIIVSNFVGPYAQQVRVVGEAAQPQSVPYRAHMTALDAIITVGGLTQYAAGNRASLVRSVDGKETTFRLRLDDLLKDGDIKANVDLQPGDVIIIPQSYF